jgi:hypothetical protein
MFDINATDGSTQKVSFDSPITEVKQGDAPVAPANALDSFANRTLHSRLLSYYIQELDRQNENRMEMALDEDYYDSIQWRAEDKASVEDRGQMALVYNVIKTSIDWLLGTEKQARTDYDILPRRKEERKTAERKSQLLKYLSDVNAEPFASSRAFADQIKAGVGWMEDTVQDGDFDEPLVSRYESWRNILWDSSATEQDLDDARYIARTKWVDEDVAMAMFEDRAQLISESCSESDTVYALDSYGDDAMDSQEQLQGMFGFSPTGQPSDVFFARRRVRLIEMWFKTPVKINRISGGPFHGEIFDPASRGHQTWVNTGVATISQKVMMRVHVAIFTQKGLIWLSESPFRHNKYPFTPYWCNRRGRDGMPYGVIRSLRGIQDDINKRASKALHIISTNKVIMDEGAVDDIDEFREEISRPDAIIVKKVGKQLDINVDREIAPMHMDMMRQSIAMIQQIGGVTDELMGRTTNAVSGIAVQSRQSQGVVANATPFDNMRYAKQKRGEKQLSNIEQFMSEKKQFRITNQRRQPEYVSVNDGLPENDIVRCKADYVISEADWNATLRQAAANALLEAARTWPPQLAVAILDLVVENMDLPNREEIVRRIRELTGQKDPDQEEPSPDDVARQQAAAKQQAYVEEMAMAQLGKLKADTALAQAKAQESANKSVGLAVTAEKDSLDAATVALTSPAVAHVADVILHEAGFVSRSEKEQTLGLMMDEIEKKQQAAAAQQQAAQAQQQQQQQPATQQAIPQQPDPTAQPGLTPDQGPDNGSQV